MRSENIYQSTSLIASGIVAFLAISSIWPYGFFQLVRWIVCFSAAYNAYQHGLNEKYFWSTIFVFIAILFNPIAPIHFNKEIWQYIDFIVGTVMIVAYVKFRKEEIRVVSNDMPEL